MINKPVTCPATYHATQNGLSLLKKLINECQCLDPLTKSQISDEIDFFAKTTTHQAENYLDTIHKAALHLNNRIRSLTGNDHYVAKCIAGGAGVFGMAGVCTAGVFALTPIVPPIAITSGVILVTAGAGLSIKTYLPNPGERRDLYLAMKPILKSLYNLVKTDYENQHQNQNDCSPITMIDSVSLRG
ncbi:hypothetical protein [Legionella clemsonensis]|uniref:Uncharacterized protein n=1 Tax=Legionella clemsonensis TaxID=1867846 RepID=A0A222P2V9_9GAMM|nr:hypothetical protein [Legionella clemsonensis]ASQ46194.1 hypothetical protein clem_08210 [Legionella clemsonensis]